MTPKQRVMTAFDHREGDLVPRWLGASPEFIDAALAELGLDDAEALRRRIGDDFRRVMARDREGAAVAELSGDAHSCTPFGIQRHGIGYGQPINHPLAEATLADVEAYAWPHPDDRDVSHIRADAEQWGGEYAILGGEWSPFWHDAIELLGMENFYFRMYDAPEVVEAVFERVVDYYAAVSRRSFEAAGDAIDIFFIGNDFGSEGGPLLGPEQFRRFVSPHLARLVDLGHEFDCRVLLHCCGGVAELIPAMIDVGLDGLHAVQPSCRGMDLATLKREYGRDILFNGAIDSRRVLIEGNVDQVREETRRVLEIMMPGGGYVAGASHDYVLPETPVANIVAMYDTVAEFGRYE